MKTLSSNKLHTTLMKDFYSRNPLFNPADSLILDHLPALRWFELLKYGVEEDVYNYQEVMKGKSGAVVTIRNAPVYMMSSYDYLGLIGHPEIEAAAMKAITEYGTGTGGVRLLTGSNALHCQLEKAISQFMGTEATMVLSSGYLANLAAIAGLFNKNDLIISDEIVHRSIADAIKVSGTPRVNFRHNDASSLKEILVKYNSVKRKLIIAEGIYSMDGDICPLPEIIALKEEYQAILMIDEAHSLGVLGKTGRGVVEHFGLDVQKIDIITGSLSKAIPSNGGFITAKEEVIIYLQHGGPPYMFSAALSPANSAAALKSLEVIDQEPQRLETLWNNTKEMKAGLSKMGMDTGYSQTPIIPVICGKIEKAAKLSRALLEEGFLANSVIYPAVPFNKARLRLCCTASHTKEIINQFLNILEKLSAQIETDLLSSKIRLI